MRGRTTSAAAERHPAKALLYDLVPQCRIEELEPDFSEGIP